MSQTVEIEIPNIPFSLDAEDVLRKSAEAANYHRVTTPHMASALIEVGREVPGDPFYGLPEIVSKRLRKRGNAMVDYEAPVKSVVLMPLAQEVANAAKIYAAGVDSPEVTSWHLGYALASIEIALASDGAGMLGSAGIQPDELDERFGGTLRFGS